MVTSFNMKIQIEDITANFSKNGSHFAALDGNFCEIIPINLINNIKIPIIIKTPKIPNMVILHPNSQIVI